MIEVCEGAPVAVGGWVLTDGHDHVLLPQPAVAGATPRGVKAGARIALPEITPFFTPNCF